MFNFVSEQLVLLVAQSLVRKDTTARRVPPSQFHVPTERSRLLHIHLLKQRVDPALPCVLNYLIEYLGYLYYIALRCSVFVMHAV